MFLGGGAMGVEPERILFTGVLPECVPKTCIHGEIQHTVQVIVMHTTTNTNLSFVDFAMGPSFVQVELIRTATA